MTTEVQTTQDQSTQPAAASSEETRTVIPAIRLFENENEWTLEAEMPGVKKDGVTVNTEDDKLIISGRRSVSAPDNGRVVHRESSNYNYRRVFELHPSINTAGITAKIDAGVLKVTLPKQEKVKPRTIAVS